MNNRIIFVFSRKIVCNNFPFIPSRYTRRWSHCYSKWRKLRFQGARRYNHLRLLLVSLNFALCDLTVVYCQILFCIMKHCWLMSLICLREYLKSPVLALYCFRSTPARYLMLYDRIFHLCMRTLMTLSCIFHFVPIVFKIRPLPLLQWNTASATLGLGCIMISWSLTMKKLNSYSLVHVTN